MIQTVACAVRTILLDVVRTAHATWLEDVFLKLTGHEMRE